MMTKEERALLAKISKLINSADPNGYIAAAFRGCVDLAGMPQKLGNMKDWRG